MEKEFLTNAIPVPEVGMYVLITKYQSGENIGTIVRIVDVDGTSIIYAQKHKKSLSGTWRASYNYYRLLPNYHPTRRQGELYGA